MNKTGFTLIELLVVVLIIGILAAVALPQYQRAVAKARFVQVLTLNDAIVKAQRVFFMANNRYADSFDELDIKIPQPANSHCDPRQGNTSLCYLFKKESTLLVLETDFESNKTSCCTYPYTNYEGDALCKDAMNVTTWSNGCSQAKPCHCFRQK